MLNKCHAILVMVLVNLCTHTHHINRRISAAESYTSLSTCSFMWLANILQKYFLGKFEDLSANLLNRLKMCQQFQIEMYKVFLFNIRYTINIGHGIEKPKI